MRPSDAKLEQSPLVAIYKAVGMLNSDWQVDFGTPQGDGWISGSALERPDHQPFKDLLRRIAERLNTNDRREVAAAFAIRLGWSAGAAIAPYFLQQCVPDIRLPNISLKFSEDTLFQKLSLHEPCSPSAPVRQKGGIEEESDCLRSQGDAHFPFITLHEGLGG